MDRERALKLARHFNRADVCDPANVDLLQNLTLVEREDFAYHSQTVMLYLGDEVRAVMRAEEEAALVAAPAGYELENLNGLNIGCGDRVISPYLLQVDIMRAPKSLDGEHDRFVHNALLSNPDDLPFKRQSIDLIVSLHTLEHMIDPASVVLHWLDVLKPGGGIGIVVPDWRYAWDARNDAALYGHKWNPTPEIVNDMYERHWRAIATLERLASIPYRASFDFVLRKTGVFEPFRPPHEHGLQSGRDLHHTLKRKNTAALREGP
jgi:predicted SAM-dependent methyltransferase